MKILSFLKSHLIVTIAVSLVAVSAISYALIKIINHPEEKSNVCIITFDSNGGSSIDSLQVDCGSTISTLEATSKTGFNFIGWYLDNEAFDITKPIDGDTTLLAKYIKDENTEVVTVKFDSNGGSAIRDIEISKGSSVSKPSNPIFIGYKFLGWYLNDSEFDFSAIINEDITLTAKWRKLENNETNDISNGELAKYNQVGGKKVKCSGAYYKDIPEKTVSTGYNDHFNWTFSTGLSYTTDDCYLTFKSTNNEVAVISNEGKINAKAQGETIVSECINDKETNTEIGCFQGKLIVRPQTCSYTIDKNLTNFFNTTYTENSVESWVHSIMSYDEGCKMDYSSDNSNVAYFNGEGKVVTKNPGTVNLSSCIVEKATGKKLYCHSSKVEVLENNENKEKKGLELVNAIKNNYWYLDGYEYAYIYPKVEDWYDHQTLSWESKYIDLVNNKFIAAEENGTYGNSDNIHNKFLVNPLKFAYELIDDYNMHVENNKLYITMGGKIYSFTKRGSEKSVTTDFEFEKTNYTVDEYTTFKVKIILKPYFANYSWDITSSDSKGLYCSYTYITMGTSELTCEAYKDGNYTVNVRDTNFGVNKNFYVTVNNVSVALQDMQIDKKSINLLRGESEKIIATFTPNNADNKNIEWRSSDSRIASVFNGKVSANYKGTATIYATTEEGNIVRECTVNVTNPPLKATADIGYSTRVGSNYVASGVVATVTATGGSGSYKYSISLYRNDEEIGHNSNVYSREVFVTGYRSGSFYAKYTVTDTDGETYEGTTNITTISV